MLFDPLLQTDLSRDSLPVDFAVHSERLENIVPCLTPTHALDNGN